MSLRVIWISGSLVPKLHSLLAFIEALFFSTHGTCLVDYDGFTYGTSRVSFVTLTLKWFVN